MGRLPAASSFWSNRVPFSNALCALPDIFSSCTETTYSLMLGAGALEADPDVFLADSDWAREVSGKIRTVRRNRVVNLCAFIGTTLGGKVFPRHCLYFGKKSGRGSQ